jgi:hypothetical protein
MPNRLTKALGATAIVVLSAAVATVVTRATDSSGKSTSSQSSSPGIPTDHSATSAAKVASAYYLAVKAGNARQAYALLCVSRQTGYDGYAHEVELDAQTGTGIADFTLTTAPSTSAAGDTAQVPAHITLANGVATPIDVLMTYGAGSWKVCSSDLGGILPGPGLGAGSPRSTATPGTST